MAESLIIPASDMSVPPIQSTHDRIIGGLARPNWLIRGSLLDDIWPCRTDSREKSRKAPVDVRFEGMVLPNTTLRDPRLEHDLITAKLICYYGLSASDGSYESASNIPLVARNYLQFVRWRLSRGLLRNEDLTAEWLDELFESIHDGGILGILPLETRLEDWANSVRAGEIQIPGYQKGRKQFALLKPAAEAFGIENTTQLPKALRRRLWQLCEEMGFALQPKQKAALQTEESRDHARAGGMQSYNRINAFLMPIQMLHGLRHRLNHDAIAFDPFPGDRTPSSVATSISNGEDNRTLTVPSLQACTLIDHALTWVLDYAAEIRRYVEELQDLIDGGTVTTSYRSHEAAQKIMANSFVPQTSTMNEVGSPWPIHHNYYPGKHSQSRMLTARPALRTVLFDYMVPACIIVIAAFSARRRQEIESLREGCINYEGDQAWLESWIAKTRRDLDSLPVPVSVARSVEILTWLSETRRRRLGESWLLAFDDLVSCAEEKGPNEWDTGFSIYRGLERFALFVQLPPLPDGSTWVPKPHQFRRFFGVTYYHHYRFAHLTALSHFYRHYDPDMTRRYITEAVRGGFLRRAEEARVREKKEEREARLLAEQRFKDFEASSLDFRRERFKNVATGNEEMTGHGGEALTRQLHEHIESAKLRLELGPAEDPDEFTLDKLVLEFAVGKRLEPNGLGHSYCKCTGDPQDVRSAACLDVRQSETGFDLAFSAPDPAYAADHVCSGCPHNVQFAENEAYWTELIARQQNQARCALGPIIAAAAAGRLAMAEEHVARCFPETKS